MKMAAGLWRLALASGMALAWGSGAVAGDLVMDGRAPGSALAARPPQCPGKPPPPRACNTVRCNAEGAEWEEVPVPVGTPCNGTGHCDGFGGCEPAPPIQQTLHVQ